MGRLYRWLSRLSRHQDDAKVVSESRRGSVDPPVIVYESGDMSVFDSVEKAERYLEAFYLSEVVAYDSKGRVLHLKERPWKFNEPEVLIESGEENPTHASELRALLIDSLRRAGEELAWLSQASLNELVSKALQKFGTE